MQIYSIEKIEPDETINAIETDAEFNPLLLSIGQYELFMAHEKEGMEAMQVFMHLMYTARLQKTNQVWANNEYIMQGLKIGGDRLKRAKAWLHGKGMISYIQPREAGGTMGKSYIRLNYIHQNEIVKQAVKSDSTGGVKTTPAVEGDRWCEKPASGDRGQMLEVKNPNALNKKEEGGFLEKAPSREASTDSPPDSLKSSELLGKMQDVREIYSDFPPKPTDEEKKQAVETAKKYGATAFLNWLGEAASKKPSKPLRFLLEDYGHELRVPPAVQEVTVHCTCQICKTEHLEHHMVDWNGAGLCRECAEKQRDADIARENLELVG